MLRRLCRGVSAIMLVLSPMAAVTTVSTSTALADAPASPPAAICGTSTVDDSYDIAYWEDYASDNDLSFVEVASGDNSSMDGELAADTLYYFDSGDHTFGLGPYANLTPQSEDVLVGASGAVIDGQDSNNSWLDGTNPDVDVFFLTIENFVPPQDQGVVNHDGAASWTIWGNTITDNFAAESGSDTNDDNGAAVIGGTDDVIAYNCLTDNGQYGIDGYTVSDANSVTGGPTDLTMYDNEIADNAPNGDPFYGCGCTGGTKFWETFDAYFYDNYVHDNGNIGVWFDTNNDGIDVEDNWISGNAGNGVMIEISYNYQIQDNTIEDNGYGSGISNGDFPTGDAIYLSESGGDDNIPGEANYEGDAYVRDNNLVDNYDGIIAYENSQRYCPSEGVCTLDDPSTYNNVSCTDNDVEGALPTDTPDYFDNCRWHVQNLSVYDNTVSFTLSDLPSDVQTVCEETYNPYECDIPAALFSNWRPEDSPYPYYTVPENIVENQNNSFYDNTYTSDGMDPGFVSFNQGNVVDWFTWTAGTSSAEYTGDPAAAQDASGSTCTYDSGSC